MHLAFLVEITAIYRSLLVGYAQTRELLAVFVRVAKAHQLIFLRLFDDPNVDFLLELDLCLAARGSRVGVRIGLDALLRNIERIDCLSFMAILFVFCSFIVVNPQNLPCLSPWLVLGAAI